MRSKKVFFRLMVVIVLVLTVGGMVACKKKKVDETELDVELTITEEPEKMDKPQSNEIIKNGEIVFHYDADKDKFISDGDDTSGLVDLKELASGITIMVDGETDFREEVKSADVYYAGTMFVPKSIEYSELEELINSLSYVSYLRYQEEHPETKSEMVMFMGEAETNLSDLNYAEFDSYEYKKLTNVTVWGDEMFSEVTYSKEFITIINICLY